MSTGLKAFDLAQLHLVVLHPHCTHSPRRRGERLGARHGGDITPLCHLLLPHHQHLSLHLCLHRNGLRMHFE